MPPDTCKPGVPTPDQALSAVNNAQEWLAAVLADRDSLPDTRQDAHDAYTDALGEYVLTASGREEYLTEVRRRALMGEDVSEHLRRMTAFRAVAQERQALGALTAATWTEEEIEDWSAPLQALVTSVQQAVDPEREVRQLRYFLRKERDTYANEIAGYANEGFCADDLLGLVYAIRRTEYLYEKFDEWEERYLRERDERLRGT